jgi:hypothetical protein
MTLYNPGDTVRIIGMPNSQHAGGTVLGSDFGGNGGLGSVQGQSWYPNTNAANQFVYVKCGANGPVYQLPAANVTPAPGAITVTPLPGALPWNAPGHHITHL